MTARNFPCPGARHSGRRLLAVASFIIMLAGVLLRPTFAAFLTDYPTTVRQPDGSTLKVLLSGDEHYNWVTDADGFVILRDPDSGYCVYAARSGDHLVPTKYYVGRDNPRLNGISPRTLPSESYMRFQRSRSVMTARRDGPMNSPTSGTLNNIVIYIRFSDESEFTTLRTTYDGMFNNATNGKLPEGLLQ